MKLVIVSVKDTAAQVFGRPIFVPVGDEVNRKDFTDDLSRHPDDFELYELGSFDDSIGLIELLHEPRLVF